MSTLVPISNKDRSDISGVVTSLRNLGSINSPKHHTHLSDSVDLLKATVNGNIPKERLDFFIAAVPRYEREPGGLYKPPTNYSRNLKTYAANSTGRREGSGRNTNDETSDDEIVPINTRPRHHRRVVHDETSDDETTPNRSQDDKPSNLPSTSSSGDSSLLHSANDSGTSGAAPPAKSPVEHFYMTANQAQNDQLPFAQLAPPVSTVANNHSNIISLFAANIAASVLNSSASHPQVPYPPPINPAPLAGNTTNCGTEIPDSRPVTLSDFDGFPTPKYAMYITPPSESSLLLMPLHPSLGN